MAIAKLPVATTCVLLQLGATLVVKTAMLSPQKKPNTRVWRRTGDQSYCQQWSSKVVLSIFLYSTKKHWHAQAKAPRRAAREDEHWLGQRAQSTPYGADIQVAVPSAPVKPHSTASCQAHPGTTPQGNHHIECGTRQSDSYQLGNIFQISVLTCSTTADSMLLLGIQQMRLLVTFPTLSSKLF